MSLRSEVDEALRAAGLDPVAVEALARAALREDLAVGPDVTSLATVPADATAGGAFVAHAPGVLAGGPVAAAVLDSLLSGAGALYVLVPDGAEVQDGTRVMAAAGPTRDLLTAERTALNLLCHLSGVATLTRRWVDAVAGTGALIRDTRKTLPGLRALEKYAVRCGGGVNHRMGLGDAALVKDNHVAAAGGVAAALRAVRRAHPELPVEVECDTVGQVREAIDAGARLLLLDNLPVPQLREAVRLARTAEGVAVEASGGLTLDRAREVAETGVDYLAVGALTHSAPALDIGFDLDTVPPARI
ncbi:MAG TPA: carboxylating nicotinate-nucleotide diphosphorylase [Mycobacteriales bacterium]|nr:carboxylating nicotinate-nucleotide diphosphorylase [Mycobacteriales bacterium]